MSVHPGAARHYIQQTNMLSKITIIFSICRLYVEEICYNTKSEITNNSKEIR